MVLSGWSQAPTAENNDTNKSLDNAAEGTSEPSTVETGNDNEKEIVSAKKRKLSEVSEDGPKGDSQETRASKKLEVVDEDDDLVMLDAGDFGTFKKRQS